MPRGDNPNSRKNLIGQEATQFKKGEKRRKESIEKQKKTCMEKKIIREILANRLGVDDLNEIIDNLIERAKHDSKDFETLQASLGQKPVERVEQTNIEVSVEFEDDED